MSRDSGKVEEELHNQGLDHDLQLISDILRKKNEKKRKSWFGSEQEKKDLEKKIGSLNLGKTSDGAIRKAGSLE